jgi:hypothetical protein
VNEQKSINEKSAMVEEMKDFECQEFTSPLKHSEKISFYIQITYVVLALPYYLLIEHLVIWCEQ